MIDFVIEITLNRIISGLSEIFIKKPDSSLHFTDENYELMAWGDPINKSDFRQKFEKNKNVEFIVNNLFGHYYFIYLIKTSGDICVGNSLFSILPIYYYQSGNKIILSNNALDLGIHSGRCDISGRFILEMVLFNYPLFNSSIIEGIYLLPSNSYICIASSKWFVKKHTCIEGFFTESPDPWKKSVGIMTIRFLETVEKYLPEKPYIHSLTGGFDGRALVSTGIFYKKEFSCYSFGSITSKDTEIATILSAKAGIPFANILLNDKYVAENNLDYGLEFIRQSSGTGTFARAHYLYAAKQLAEKTEFIVTGNFGSEIFRAAHVPGVVIAPSLFELFNKNSPKAFFKIIENSEEFRILNRESLINIWDNLKEDLHKLPCYNEDYKHLTQNQKFYVFVFEEIFRKYFGAEMINQFRHLKNRTPFLDIDFLKAIFKTGLAGIHSDFFEHNPLKRYKGQVLYAHIIRKTYPPYGEIITDKGYRPDDLLSFTGKLKILKAYINKRVFQKKSDLDPNRVAKAWETNRHFWLSIPIPSEFFVTNAIRNNESIVSKELLFKILSLSYLINSSFLPQSHKDTK